MAYILTAVISFALGSILFYFIGSNNPYPAAKRKLIAKAKDSIDKILKS